MRRLAAALAPTLLLATGCGGDSLSSTQSSEADETPACDAFAGGEVIPEGFGGCMSSPDVVEAAFSYECDDGRELVAAGPVMGFVGEKAIYVDGGQAGDSKQWPPLLDECRPS